MADQLRAELPLSLMSSPSAASSAAVATLMAEATVRLPAGVGPRPQLAPSRARAGLKDGSCGDLLLSSV